MTCQGEFYSDPPDDHVARYQWAIERLKGTAGLVVDVGCGSGYGLVMLDDAGLRCVGLDRNPMAVEFARNRQTAAYVCDYPVPVYTPDPMAKWAAILMLEVMEHSPVGWDVLRVAMVDAPRVLLSVPYDEPMGENAYHHLHNLTEESFAWMRPQPVFARIPQAPESLLIDWRR